MRMGTKTTTPDAVTKRKGFKKNGVSAQSYVGEKGSGEKKKRRGKKASKSHRGVGKRQKPQK